MYSGNEESVDLCLIHGFKSIHNALEVETHTPKGMPEMALKEEESKVEMSVCQPCTSSVCISRKSGSVSEVRGESKIQLQRSAIQFDGIDRRILSAPNRCHKTHQCDARQ